MPYVFYVAFFICGLHFLCVMCYEQAHHFSISSQIPYKASTIIRSIWNAKPFWLSLHNEIGMADHMFAPISCCNFE